MPNTPTFALPREEYVERQERARTLARERGFAAVIAWSRGGGTQDQYADVYYLSGFYTQQPCVPDLHADGHWWWRATGHAAVVVPVDGPVTLVSDAEPETSSADATDVVLVTADTIAGIVTALPDRLGGSSSQSGSLGLLGANALPARWRNELQAALPINTTLQDADDIAWALRTIKRPCEQDFLRRGGALGARAISAAMNAAMPGATEADVAAALIAEIVRGGGAFYGMGVSSGPRAHMFAPSGAEHGSAAYTSRRLLEGEMLRLDAYGSVAGYLFDFARTRVVGVSATREQRELIDAVRSSVHAGIDAIRPGGTLGAIARRCDEALRGSAYALRNGMPASTMGGAWGHGLGLAFEPPWIEPASNIVVEEGMCLAIERRIEAPGFGGAQYEENVLVTESGAELLSVAPAAFDE